MKTSYKTFILIFIGFLFIGAAITKLSVRDRVILTDEEKSCAQTSVLQQFDHPFQRIALIFGKSAVIEKQKNALVVKSYTIFRIPLPTTRLFNKYTQQTICDWAVEPREISEVSQGAAEFKESMQNFVIENFGRPIDSGFTAPMYLRAFPGLLEADFDGVETSEGKYEYSDGKLAFTKTPTGRYSTFDEAILEKGHETLLINIRGRLGGDLSVDEIISRISRFEENRARLYENCAKAEIPETELDTTLDQENKFVIIRWWDDKNQKSVELKLPYYPATNFEGCSESAKKTLRHIQEAAVPQ